jgi:hypothetical protein
MIQNSDAKWTYQSSEFGESQSYPHTFDGSVFSLVTAAQQDGIHVDLNLSYTAFASPDMRDG